MKTGDIPSSPSAAAPKALTLDPGMLSSLLSIWNANSSFNLLWDSLGRLCSVRMELVFFRSTLFQFSFDCFCCHFFCGGLSLFSLEIKVEAFLTKDNDGKKNVL